MKQKARLHITPALPAPGLMPLLGSLKNKPVGILQINAGNHQTWQELFIDLDRTIAGKHDKVYLLFKGDGKANSFFKIDWFIFR